MSADLVPALDPAPLPGPPWLFHTLWILTFALQPGSPWLEVLAFFFGGAAALTLDEFALILHLEDVYWTGEGRKSIDAIILGVTFMTLLLTGLLPRQFNELSDYVTLSRWAFSLVILVGAFFVDFTNAIIITFCRNLWT